jgi:hypothetical protein
LGLVEGHVVVVHAWLSSGRVAVQEPFHWLALEACLAEYFRHIFYGHAGIKNALRVNDQHRSLLAETVASSPLQPDTVLDAQPLDFLLKSFTDVLGSDR